MSYADLEINQIVRVRPNPPAQPFDAIIRWIEDFPDERVLVEFNVGLSSRQDWVTLDMIEIPR